MVSAAPEISAPDRNLTRLGAMINARPVTPSSVEAMASSTLFVMSPGFHIVAAATPALLIPDSVVNRLFFFTLCEHPVVGKEHAILLHIFIPVREQLLALVWIFLGQVV